jgi:hypothetical protein
MKINKRKIELYNAFRDGERNQIRKDIIKQMEDMGIYIEHNKKFVAEYKKRKKEVEKCEDKYRLNEEEQRIWEKEVINERKSNENNKR